MSKRKKRDVLKLLNTELVGSSSPGPGGHSPHAQLIVTGSKLPLHKTESNEPLTPSRPLRADSSTPNFIVIPHGDNPWQLTSPTTSDPGLLSSSGNNRVLASTSAQHGHDMKHRGRSAGTGTVDALGGLSHADSFPPLAGGKKTKTPGLSTHAPQIPTPDIRPTFAFSLGPQQCPPAPGERRRPSTKRPRGSKVQVGSRNISVEKQKPAPPWRQEEKTVQKPKTVRSSGSSRRINVRQHYARHYKRKVLSAWQEEWWVERKEWKLGIRAECHNRFVGVVYHTFHSHEATPKISTVDHGVEGMDDIYMLPSGNEEKESSKPEVWTRWVLYYKERLVVARKMTAAASHFAIKWKQKVLRSWQEYIANRRKKLYLNQVAVSCRSSCLLVKFYAIWKAQLIRSRRMTEFEDLISGMGRLSICRRVMGHWKFFTALRQHHAHLLDLATQHHHLVLKSKGLLAFQQYVRLRGKMAAYNQQAKEAYVQARLRQCWGAWLLRCEHNEEIALGVQTRKARVYAGSRLKHVVLVAWVQYVIQHRHKKKLKMLADTYFRQSALPKCFEALRENVSVRKYIWNLKQQSSSFRRETLLSMGFYKWWRESQLSRDVRMLERVALLHWEERAKRNILQLWRARLEERLLHHQHEELAVSHSALVLRKGAFRRWRDGWLHRVSSSQKLEQATQHEARKLMGSVWRAWRKHVSKRRESHAFRRKGDDHYCAVICSKMMDSWQRYHASVCVKNDQLRVACHQYHVRLLKHAITQWRVFARQRKHDRELDQLASDHHMQSTLARLVRQWKEMTVSRREQRERNAAVVTDISTHLLRSKAHRLLLTWKGFAEDAVSARLGKAKADHHHCQALCYKVIRAWRARHRVVARKKLLQRQCGAFRDSWLLTDCYALWRRQFMLALQTRQKSVVSLWHWSHILEQRVLSAWLQYTAEKKRKAQRYASAMERHRAWLQGMGVRQWIKVATDVKAQRQEEALLIQAKSTQNVLRCVKRCAHHWRQVTQRHRPPPRVALGPKISLSLPTLKSEDSDLWTDLTKQLQLPEGVFISRPQPRRLHLAPSYSAVSIAESLPHLVPPPQGRGRSLDITEDPPPSPRDTCHTSSPLLVHPPSPSRSCHRTDNTSALPLRNAGHTSSSLRITSHAPKGTSSLPSASRDTDHTSLVLQTISPPTATSPRATCHTSSSLHVVTSLPPRDQGASTSLRGVRHTSPLHRSHTPSFKFPEPCHTSLHPSLQETRPPGMLVPQELPATHPLRNADTQGEILLMRQRMQRYLQLKIHRKSLLEKFPSCLHTGEREEVQRELQEVEALIKQSEPIVKHVASKINSLLQLC